MNKDDPAEEEHHWVDENRSRLVLLLQIKTVQGCIITVFDRLLGQFLELSAVEVRKTDDQE